MAVTEQEMLEDLAYTESEGPADMGEDEWDRMGGEDDFDAFGGEDDFEAEDYGEDMFGEDSLEAEEAEESVARTLVASGGPKAIRALPKIAKSVRRTAASKGTPPAMRPKVLARTAAKVAQRPGLLRNLSRPSPKGQAIAQRAGNGSVRNITVPSGATITISVS